MKDTNPVSLEALAARLRHAHSCSCGHHGHQAHFDNDGHQVQSHVKNLAGDTNISTISCEEISNDAITQKLASDFDHLKL
jgi:hypothetical protein